MNLSVVVSFAIFFSFAIQCNEGSWSDKEHIGETYNDIYKDCGSQTGTIVSVAVTDCTKLPCVFVRGKNYTLDLEFTSKVNSNKAANKVYGVIAKVPVPFHLPEDDGCTLGIQCPFAVGANLKESVTLPVLAEYPKLSLYVEWKVEDDNGKLLVCFLFPVILQ